MRHLASIVALAGLLHVPSAFSHPRASQPQPAPQAPTPSFRDSLRADAARVNPLVSSDLARSFLASADHLPEVTPRSILRDKSRGLAVTPDEYKALPEAERAGFTPRVCDESFFHCTGYGSPLTYARPIDLLAARAAISSLEGCKTLDFGYGMIGQVRLMALMGAEAHGVDVEPVLRALYSLPQDTGPIGEHGGSVTLHHGRWPADPAIAEAVGGGYDLFISKNTLKRGYIHPARPARPEQLVDLGVSDEAFIAAMHDALKPGGLAMVYNICPPQSPPDADYIPWADGEFPFARERIELQGFEVLAWDERDSRAAAELLAALGYGQGKPVEALADDYPTWFTLLRKK